MGTRLGDLVDSLGGELIGDPEFDITGIAPLDAAGPSHITFLSNTKLRAQAAQTRAAALILAHQEHSQLTGYAGTRVLTDNPYAYFARVAQRFAAQTAIAPAIGVHAQAWVDPGANVAASASIGPGATVEAGAQIGEYCVIGAGCHIGRNAVIGAHTLLHPRVSFLAGCQIGERGIIQSGAVIGGDGFGFANEAGHWVKIPQMGAVRIGNDVEIGANTTIDRGALEDTVIGDGVKIDNLVQIGHNCTIGAHTALAGCVGLAGSSHIGARCRIGGGVGVTGHLTICDDVTLMATSFVTADIREPGVYAGGSIPIESAADWRRIVGRLKRIDGLNRRVVELERHAGHDKESPDEGRS